MNPMHASKTETVARRDSEERGGISSFAMPGLAKLIDGVARRYRALGSAGVSVGIARKLVHAKFSAMTRGHLVIHEGSQNFQFGNLDIGKDEPSAHIHVVNDRVYKRIALNGVIGAAEAFMDGDWETPDLVSVVRFMVYNLAELERVNEERSLLNRVALSLTEFLTRNSVSRSKENIAAHYDLGNDFFELFLDPTMMYSSALFTDERMSLEDASLAKLEALCQKLCLKSSDHLVEIGTGWGGMAIYAAEHYGCRVTTTTISEEQYRHTLELVKEKDLQDKITVLKKDYRLLEGKFDKLVSIEMIEAVGHQYFGDYFRKCSSLLKTDGVMAIQAITITDQRYERAKNSMDFIKRYIFPGGCLPSVNCIANHVSTDTDMIISDMSDMALDYAETLKRWREAFFANIEKVRELGFDERFIRMWEYYLCYCEGGFRERVIGTTQMVMTKPDFRPAPVVGA